MTPAAARERVAVWLPMLAAGVLAGSAATARAFSDPAAFAAPVLEAGGGGRFYTGSPAEGYACDGCHRGGAAPALRIEGLPARYVPRATYELRVSWPRDIEHASAALELTDERGYGAGTLALPGAAAYLPEEECEPHDVGLLAAQLYAADRERTVAATPDCGASTLRVQWTAPAEDVGPVWFAGSVLTSDHDGNFGGDGVSNFARPIPAFGSALPDVVTRGGCSLSRPRSDAPALLLLLLLHLALALRRVRLRRQIALRSVRQASTNRWSS